MIAAMPILPLKTVELLYDEQLDPDFLPPLTHHMCLAHLMMYPKYAAYYSELHERGDYVVMDNSVVELGVTLHTENLLAIYKNYPVTEVILPDALGDDEETILLTLNAYEEFQGVANPPNYMVVPQGKTINDYLSCAYTLSESIPHATIGVTKRSCPGIDRDLTLVPILWANIGNPLHLLGMSRQYLPPHEVCEQVRSIDSAVAAFFADKFYVWHPSLARISHDEFDFTTASPGRECLQEGIKNWVDFVQGVRP